MVLTERETERDFGSERERVWFGEHLLHPTLCVKPFVFDQMSSWYSAAGYGWSVSYGSWYGRRSGSCGGKSKVRSEGEWFCHKCSTGNWWSRTDCRHCARTILRMPRRPRAGMGNGEPISAGKRVLEKELERHQQKLSCPKNISMARRTQNWINREATRIERRISEFGKKPRASLTKRSRFSEKTCCERENRWTKRSHIMFPESTAEIRNHEQQEPNLWRGAVSKRQAE